MKRSVLFTLLCVLSGSAVPARSLSQTFDKAGFYSALASGNPGEINAELSTVKASSIKEKDAYEGTLLMRKAGLLSHPKEKLNTFKLGATKLETIIKIVLPQAMPGIMTGGILAVSRAAGEVAPILFTGAAYYMKDLPKSLTDQFMDLGYHIFILSTQSPNVEKTKPILYATVVVLLFLTFALNIVAIFIRARMRKKLRLLA